MYIAVYVYSFTIVVHVCTGEDALNTDRAQASLERDPTRLDIFDPDGKDIAQVSIRRATESYVTPLASFTLYFHLSRS